jgi:hypothetical protein
MAKKSKRLPVASLGSAVPTASDKEQQRRYQVESALSTMQRAEEIRKDKSLMGDIKKLAKEQMQSLGKVAK